MRRGKGFASVALSMALLSSGCATAGGVSPTGGSGQVQNTVYQTHRMVQNLESSVANLTQTTAEISSRMDASDLEMRRLVSIAEENQRKLDGLQGTLDQLTATLYQQMNLSPPARTTPPVDSNAGRIPQQPEVQVVPPSPQPQITPPDTTRPEIAPPGELLETTGSANDPEEHYRIAQQYYSDADYAMALKQFDEHLAKFPTSPHLSNATYWRAQSYLKMGDYPAAISGFEQFRTQHSSSGKIPIALHNEAVAHSRLGQTERAKALFQQLIREYPDDVATEGARKNLRQLQGLGQ